MSVWILDVVKDLRHTVIPSVRFACLPPDPVRLRHPTKKKQEIRIEYRRDFDVVVKYKVCTVVPGTIAPDTIEQVPGTGTVVPGTIGKMRIPTSVLRGVL